MSRASKTKEPEHKSTSALIACAIISCSLLCTALANSEKNGLQKDSALQVHLPREVTVEDSCLRLGQISIIRGQESLVDKANEITVGQISMPGQKVTIDKSTILSRLACNGIPASKLALTGAEKVTITQQQQTVSSDELVTLASSFLEKNPPAASACRWSPIRRPKHFVIPWFGKDVRFSSRLVPAGARNQARVAITVISGDEKIGEREVVFGLEYHCRQATTKIDIPAGGVISPENVKIETVPADHPEPADWKPPYGLVAKRRLPANTVLAPYMVTRPKAPVVVKRNQNVVIRIEKPGFLITAVGKTLQDGKVGEYIRVRNVDSQRIILARINEDGTVEPAS